MRAMALSLHDTNGGTGSPGCFVIDEQSVSFAYRNDDAKSVHVAGDFSGWKRSASTSC